VLDRRVRDRALPAGEHEPPFGQCPPPLEGPVAVFGLGGGQHGPSRAEPDHLAQHFRLVALGSDLDRCSERGQFLDDHRAGVGPGREQHPWPPEPRCPHRFTGRGVDGERLGEQRLGGDAVAWRGGFHAHHHVEFPGGQQVEQRRRRRDTQQQVDVAMLVAEAAECFGVVHHGGGVDHADAEPARPSGAETLAPRRQILGEPQHLAGMTHRWCGAAAHQTSPPLAFEQRHPQPSFEFGETL